MGKINYGAKFGKTGFPQPKLKTKKIEYPAGPRSVEKDTIVELTELQKDFRAAAKKAAKKSPPKVNDPNRDKGGKFKPGHKVKEIWTEAVVLQQLNKLKQCSRPCLNNNLKTISINH